MKCKWQKFSLFVSAAVLCLLLGACSGDTPWRFDPGAPDKPVALTATAESGQVSLSWPSANNAAAYYVYFSTSPNVSTSIGNRVATVVGTSYIQTGLTNGTTCYFVITSVNSNSESAASNQVSTVPALPGPYAQGDMTGSWNFNILVSGAGAGWLRGTLSVDGSGAVTFSSFLDSAGNSLPPVALFPVLLMNSNGQVRNVNAGVPSFQGVMAASRKMIVGNVSPGIGSYGMVVLQKQVPGVAFSPGDLQGFGNTGGGGRRFIYNQISSGSSQEWEYASGQLGKDQKTQYTAISAPSNPVTPGDKASILNITADGIVTESRTAALPQPAVVIDRGVMSADKSVIIGTATDTSGANPKYVLRIYQLVNIVSSDPNTFSQADLAGTYDLRKLTGGVSILSASGTVMIDALGVATYSAYADSNGTVTLPAGLTLAMDASGNLINAADASFQGKLSYFKDMFVATGTDSPGTYSLSIALKR